MEAGNSCIAAAVDFVSGEPFPKVGFRAAFAHALDGVRHCLRQFGVVHGINAHSGIS
jgi:hypothetical protein